MNNTINNLITIKTNNNNFTPKTNWQKGDILTGKVIEKNKDTIKIDFEGKEITVKNHINIQEKMNDIIKFQVEEIDKSNIKLKYINDNKKNKKVESKPDNKILTLQEIIEKNKMKATEYNLKIAEKVSEENIEENKKYFDMASKLKKALESIANKVTDKDVEEVIKNNYNPEKISVDIFSKIIDNNKVAVKTNNYDKLQAEIEEEIEKYAHKLGTKKQLKQIINKLKDYNMPVNEKNIEKIKKVLHKVDTIKNITNNDIVNILKQNKDLTVENIYVSKHLGNNNKQNVNYKTDKNQGYIYENNLNEETNNIDELEPQIKKILDDKKITVTKENVDLAKLLIKNEIPLNNETLNTIKNLKENINKISEDEIIEQSVKNIIEEKNPSQISIVENKEPVKNELTTKQNKKIEAVKNDIKNIDIKDIKRVIAEGKELNLQNLIEESKEEDTEPINLNESQNMKAIKARLNVEEIRLKMTMEAATKLSLKGIKVDVEPVDTVVKELRTLEKQQYEKYLEINNVEPTKENIEVIEKLYEKVDTIKNMPAKVMSNIIDKSVDFTIDDIAKSTEKELVNELKANKAVSTYDELGTKPRTDLGDKIEKTFDQIDNILEDLGLEKTEKNIRAAKILAKNQMEITVDNIEAVKLIDNKLMKITEGLHPNIVVNMIKDKMSPIKMHIDEVLQYMKNFDEQLGQTTLEKIAEHIHNLDNSEFTTEERESLIGIYRMLTTISKSEGTALGFLMKNNMDLNLDNLFEASKYIKNTKGIKKVINVNVNDDFGVLKELKYNEKTIKQQILTALEKDNIQLTKNNVNMANALDELNIPINDKTLNRIFNNTIIFEQFIEKAYPNKLLQLKKEGQLKNQLEKLNEIIPKQDIVNKKSINDIINKLKGLTKLNEETLKNLEKYAIPKNIDNLNTAKMLKEEPFEFTNRMKNIIKELDDSNISTNSLKKSINKVIDNISKGTYDKSIEDIKDNINKISDELVSISNSTSANIKEDTKTVNDIVKYQQLIGKEEDYYQVPIMIGDELKQLNMYVLNNKNANTQTTNDEMKIHMYFETKSMGSIQAYVNIKENNMDFGIYTSNKDDMDLIQTFGKEIKNILSSTMYNIGDVEYSYFKGESPIETESIEPVQNKSRRYYDTSFEKII
jgi:hypothetical protein